MALAVLLASCGGPSRQASLRVAMDGNPLQCQRTRVSTVEVETHGVDFATPAVQARAGMHCTLHFHVFNDGTANVLLQNAVVPLLGPEGGAGIEAVELSPLAAKPRAGEIDAILSLDDYPLDADSGIKFEVVLTFRRDGCTPVGSDVHVSDAPVVSGTAGGDTLDAAFVGPAYALRGSRDSTCDK